MGADGLGNVAQHGHPQARADIDVALPVRGNGKFALSGNGTELVRCLPKGCMDFSDIHGPGVDPKRLADTAAVGDILLLPVRQHDAIDVFRPEGAGAESGGHG